MKKLIPVAALLLLATAFSSCTKNYTCVCTLASGGGSGTTVKYDLGKKTRSDANSECEAKETSVLGLSYTCELD